MNDLAPVRTVVATLLGGAAGAVAVGYAAALLAEATGAANGLAAVGVAVVAAGAGVIVGAALGLWVAFGDAPRSERRTTVVTVLLAGPVLFGGLAAGLAQITRLLSVPQLHLVVALLATALAGRWLATRDADRARWAEPGSGSLFSRVRTLICRTYTQPGTGLPRGGAGGHPSDVACPRPPRSVHALSQLRSRAAGPRATLARAACLGVVQPGPPGLAATVPLPGM